MQTDNFIHCLVLVKCPSLTWVACYPMASFIRKSYIKYFSLFLTTGQTNHYGDIWIFMESSERWENAEAQRVEKRDQRKESSVGIESKVSARWGCFSSAHILFLSIHGGTSFQSRHKAFLPYFQQRCFLPAQYQGHQNRACLMKQDSAVWIDYINYKHMLPVKSFLDDSLRHLSFEHFYFAFKLLSDLFFFLIF